jgi:glycyl-tRNA synthetase beta chain
VGAADRLDTLAAMFAVGERPTGSKDPFGLRRAAQGLVRIVAESGWNIDLDAAADDAAHRAAAIAGVPDAPVAEAMREFLVDRVRRYLVEVTGVSGDTADATMAADWRRLPQLAARARALEGARMRPEFRSLALAFKRVRNITENQPDAGIDPARFELPAESELHRGVLAFHERLAELVPANRLDEAFAAMAPIAEVLDRFFVDVLVMAEDEAVRANRIALLKALGRDFFKLADLSRLQVEGSET